MIRITTVFRIKVRVTLVATAVAAILYTGQVAALCTFAESKIHLPTEHYLPNKTPEGCTYLYRYPVDAQVSSKHVQYKDIRKRDFICFGDEIIIDQPILTNGGDVKIFANKVQFYSFTNRNTIDTRIFSNISRFDPFEENRGVVKVGKENHYLLKHDVVCRVREYQDKLYQSYYSYYFDDTHALQVDSINRLVPRLPDGLIPASVGFQFMKGNVPPSNGLDAPVLNMQSQSIATLLKSGSVEIFADELVGPTKLQPAGPIPSSVSASCPQVLAAQEFKIIQVGGLVGGRGGPGATARCVPGPPTRTAGRISFGVNCYRHARNWHDTGYAGAQSYGGSPGEITLVTPAQIKDDNNLATTDNGIVSFDVQAGPLAFGKQPKSNPIVPNHFSHRSPRPAKTAPPQVGHVATGSLCDFFSGEDRITKAYSGEYRYAPYVYQPTIIQKKYNQEVFEDFVLDIVALDNMRSYDYNFLLSYQDLQANPIHLTMQDYLAAQIFEMNRKAQIGVIQAIRNLLLDKKDPVYVLPIFMVTSDLERLANSVSSSSLKAALRQALPFQYRGPSFEKPLSPTSIIGTLSPTALNIDAGIVRSYIQKVDGVAFDLRDDWEIKQRLNFIKEIGLEAVDSVDNVALVLMNIENDIKQKNFQADITGMGVTVASMENQIVEINKLIDEIKKKSSEEAWLLNAFDVVSNISKVVTTFTGLSSLRDDPTKLAKLGGPLKDLTKSISKLIDDDDSLAQVPELLIKISKLRGDLRTLRFQHAFAVSEFEDYRNTFLENRLARMDKNLNARVSSRERKREMNAVTHDAVKAILLDYLIPLSSDPVRLDKNLNELLSLLNKGPINFNPDFKIIPFDNSLCKTVAQSGCKEFDSGNQAFSVVHDFEIGSTKLRLPLYVISPSSEKVLAQTFGLKVTVEK